MLLLLLLLLPAFITTPPAPFPLPVPPSIIQGEGHVAIKGNGTLHSELHTRISARLDHVLSIISTDVEVNEEQQLVGLCGLYALHRILLPPAAVPDRELFTKFWQSQRKVPLVPLYGKVVWTADAFILKFCPLRTVDVTKVSPKDPAAHRRAAAAALSDAFPARVANVRFLELFPLRVCSCISPPPHTHLRATAARPHLCVAGAS